MRPIPRTRVQCPSVCVSSRGRAFTFCVKREGHAGDHRGLRAQWAQNGKRVPITEGFEKARRS